MIFMQSIITFVLGVSFVGTLREILSSGVLVWHRDNLGTIISQFIFHVVLLRTLILLKRYILLKEQRQWHRDKE